MVRVSCLLFLSVSALACGGTAGTHLADTASDADVAEEDTGGDRDAEEYADGDRDADSRNALDGDAEQLPDVEAWVGCEAQPEVVAQPLLSLGEHREGLILERCSEHRLNFVAPATASLEISVMSRGVFPLQVAVTYPDNPAWDQPLVSARLEQFGQSETLLLEPGRSGEYVISLRSELDFVEAGYDIALVCLDGCDLESTRYPIMLVHGWMGFVELGPAEYFYHVPETLRQRGYWVAVASMDPFNSIEVRSEQLAEQVDEVLVEARALKVNLIAHSQGGLDSRRLISTLGYGDRVSSLTTIGTPHRGTPLCDAALGLVPGFGEEAMFFLIELLGAVATGSESDAEASFRTLTEEHVQATFNPSNPDDRRVSYISWAGLTCLVSIGCDDACDAAIVWSHELLLLLEGDNDGIVPVSSAMWGDYRGEIAADHFDEVGQLFGMTGPNFDHEEFYLERARDLAGEGH